MRLSIRVAAVAFAIALCSVQAVGAVSGPVAYTTFIDKPAGYQSMNGFTYAGNKFVGSFGWDGVNTLYSTDLSGGNFGYFAPSCNVYSTNSFDEHFVAGSLGVGGFPANDIYVAAGLATGNPWDGGSVMHIANDGSSCDVFVTNLTGTVRGILFDSIGTFGYDMVVATNLGGIFRITSGGVVTQVAALGEDAEGMDLIPTGAAFGPFAGQLVVGSENSGKVRAISAAGVVTEIATVSGAEQVSYIPVGIGSTNPLLEGLYSVGFQNKVFKADPTALAPYLGDLLVTSEFDYHVYDIHWDGSAFVTTDLGRIPETWWPEDGIVLSGTVLNPGGGGGTCPLSPGYWKTHSNWSVSSLTLGARTYTRSQATKVLGTSPKGDASLVLAHQLIAAKLDVANGSNPSPVSATIALADSLLSTYSGSLPYKVPASSVAGQRMISAAQSLANYINGLLTVGCTGGA